MKFAIPTLLAALAAFFTFSAVERQPATEFDAVDVSGIEFAVLDYVEGIYNVQPERIERSVSKDLVKYGFWRESADEDYRGSAMTYEQLHKLSAGWNADNKQNVTEKTPKEIKVLDVLDKTATAKLTAKWGIDYFQLEKTGDKWMIRHVLWQAHP